VDYNQHLQIDAIAISSDQAHFLTTEGTRPRICDLCQGITIQSFEKHLSTISLIPRAMHNPRFADSCMDGVVVLWGKRGLCIDHGINDHLLFSAN
jgi:hypothetical protein